MVSLLPTQGWTATVIYLVLFFAILYFLMIRPQQQQQKKRQKMLSEVKVNDPVITVGGIHGRITRVKDTSVIVRIADKVEIEVEKTGIGYVGGKEGD